MDPALTIRVAQSGSNWWPVVVAAMVTGFVGVAGVVVGGGLERRATEDAWRRDRRMSACSDVIAAGHDFVVSVALFRGAGETRRMEQLAAMTDALLRVERAVATVRIVGSPGLAKEALAVASSVSKFYATNVQEAGVKVPRTAPDEPQVPVMEAINRFADVACSEVPGK
jgi:hypothetical protein